MRKQLLSLLLQGSLVISSSAVLGALPAQTPSDPPRTAEESVQVEVSSVLLDVVVTDKNGKRVPGIPIEEFEVFEDGMRQKLQSLRELKPFPAPDASRPAPITGVSESAQLSDLPSAVVILVFDRLSPSGRKLARDAAIDYLKRRPQNHLVSVMSIDRKLRVLTSFTTDSSRLTQAIEAIAASAPEQFEDLNNKVRESIRRERQSFDDAMQAPQTNKGGLYSDAKLNQVLTDILRQTAMVENTAQSFSTLDSLLAIVDSTHALQGRKAVVFFAEKLQLPVQALDKHRDLISAANRANVSIYCIDPAGLGSPGQLEDVGSGLRAISETNSIGQRRVETMSDKSVRREEVMMGETAENTIRTPTSSTLAGLSESTGGLAVTNTNDVAGGLRAVSDDLGAHYELSYASSNPKYDGAFRKIQVKIRRPGVQVRARSGYYAVPAGLAAVRSFEIPMLNSFARSTLPSDLVFHTGALIFPAAGTNFAVVLAVEVPLAGLTLRADSSKGPHNGIQLLMVLKDQTGQVVQKVSREFPVEARKDLQNASFYYHENAELPPGHFSLEAAVRDPVSGKLAARRTGFDVPPLQAFATSSLVLVHAVDTAGNADDLIQDPLQIGEQVVMPEVSGEFAGGPGKVLPFFFTVHRPPTAQSTDSYRLTISRDGKPVASSGDQIIPPPDNAGVSRCSMTLPLDSIQPGLYEAEIVVQAAGDSQKTRASFRVR